MIDTGIIGPPPRREGVTRFYASGERLDDFLTLGEYGLDVRVVGPQIGQASGFKMCYASQTKGRYAIFIESLVAAQRQGFYEALAEELKSSQSATFADIERAVPGIPAKSERWIGEMEEIAKTFADLDMTERIFDGAADLYRAVNSASVAAEPGEEPDLGRLVEQLATGME